MRNYSHWILGTIIAAFVAATTLAIASESMHQWSLQSGFEPDPKFVEVSVGGATQSGCGHVPDEPQLVINYESGTYELSIGTLGSGVDTTLEVKTPSGNIICDDDSGGDGDALVTLDDPESGRYEIRVGTYSSDGISKSANVYVTERLDDRGLREEIVQWSLEYGFEPDPKFVEVSAGGGTESGCGHLPDEPQLAINYESGTYELSIGTLGSGVDTTLEVKTPSGNIICDDDSGGDGNALVTLDDPESGRYEIRVGAYSSDGIGRNTKVFVTERLGGEDSISSGTGFLVTDNHIVTNWHVIDGATGSVTVRALGVPEFEAVVVVYNEEADIALLYTEEKPESLGAAVFRTHPPISVGESVFAFGFPVDGGNFTRGEVSALTGHEGDLTGLQFTAPIQPGSSGSPLFDDQGKVVGMVTSTREGGQLVNFAVRGTMIRIFLDSNNVAYSFSESNGSVPPKEINSMVRKVVVALIVDTS